MPSHEDVKGESDAELVSWGLEIESGLTDWEITFLEDMKIRVDEGSGFTEAMRGKLEQIVMEKG